MPTCAVNKMSGKTRPKFVSSIDRAVHVDDESADEHERERVGLVPQKRPHDDVEPGQCGDDPQRDPLVQAALGVAVGGVLQADE